ncbi:Flp pilus assembly complex ATPase component TadA (plasmid) [Diaphorobacter sp. MNS-0]|nr:Flp pilus assembly complex ATPase component TadA [Diaphorobacter sp. MNS-0]
MRGDIFISRTPQGDNQLTSTKDKQRHLLEEKLRRECGIVFMEGLESPKVNELALNPDGRLWFDIAGSGWTDIGETMAPAQSESLLATCASMLHTCVTRENPILEGEFPLDGSRLEGLIYPVVRAPTFTVRKKATSIFTFEDYKARGIIRPLHTIPPRSRKVNMLEQEFGHPVEAIRAAVSARKNILVVGGTGSGKTTLVNAVLHEIGLLTPHDRMVAIEDTMELQVNIANAVLLRSSEHCTMQRLLRATMRLSPNRIVVGETRGAEAFTLLKSWNSGHPGGAATIHADSAEEGLDKLVSYIYESPDAKALSPEIIGRLVATAVHMVLFIEKWEGDPGRLVSEVALVRGYSNGRFDLQPIKESFQHAIA